VRRLRVLNIWLVFLFVAAWHDLEPRLMHWGLIMPAALVPEMVGGANWADQLCSLRAKCGRRADVDGVERVAGMERVADMQGVDGVERVAGMERVVGVARNRRLHGLGP